MLHKVSHIPGMNSIILTAEATQRLFCLLLVCCSLLTTVPALGQDSDPQKMNQTDASGKKQGLWQVKNKNITETGHYINGRKEGEWTATFPSGSKKHVLTYKNGLPKGYAIFYYEDGKIMEQGNWDVNHWKGEYTFYHANGNPAYKFNFDESGKRVGRQLYFHENGNLKYSGEWVDGKPDGAIGIFNEQGEKVSERVYTEGQFSQIIKSPKNDDQQEPAETFEVFTETGQFTLFNQNGKISRKGYFEKGKLINGQEYIYDESNKLIRVNKYSNGILVE